MFYLVLHCARERLVKRVWAFSFEILNSGFFPSSCFVFFCFIFFIFRLPIQYCPSHPTPLFISTFFLVVFFSFNEAFSSPLPLLLLFLFFSSTLCLLHHSRSSHLHRILLKETQLGIPIKRYHPYLLQFLLSLSIVDSKHNTDPYPTHFPPLPAMLRFVWVIALLLLVAGVPAISAVGTNTLQQRSATSDQNIGTSRTFPLKSTQKLNKRSLYMHSVDMIMVADVVSGKLALQPIEANTTSGDTGTALVDQDGHDISYYIEVKIGTIGDKSTNTTYNLVVDTGSFYTWVYGVSCTSSDCAAHSRLDPSDSSSINVTSDQFSISYTSGSVQGMIAIDTLSYAGFSSPMHFGLASTVDSSFADFPIDGIMGLPGKDKSPDSFPGVINTLFNQSLISERVFGINLGRGSNENDEGSFTIGGIDSSKYTGDIVYTPSIANSDFWELEVGGTFINDFEVDFGGSRTAIIDTGTTLLIMAPDDALKLHSHISGSQTDGSNFVIPCNTTMLLQFEFNGVKWTVSPEDYIGNVYSESDGTCISNIQGIQFSDNRWIFGDVFLKNMYSVYNMDTQQVGFANKTIGATNVTPDLTYVFAGSAVGTKNKNEDSSSSVQATSASSAAASNTTPTSQISSSSPSSSSSSTINSSSNTSPSISINVFSLSFSFFSVIFVVLFCIC